MKSTLLLIAVCMAATTLAQTPRSSFFMGGHGGLSSTALMATRMEVATTIHKLNYGPSFGHVFSNGLAVTAGMGFSQPYYSIEPMMRTYRERTMIESSLRWYVDIADRFSIFPEIGYRNSHLRTDEFFTGETTNRYVSSIRVGSGMNYFVLKNIALEVYSSYGVALERSFDLGVSALYFIRRKNGQSS